MKHIPLSLRIALRCALLLPCSVAVLSLFSAISFAQSSSSLPSEMEEEIERLLEELNQGEEPNPELLDLMEHYRDHPLQLRTATAEELLRLPGISPQTARRILEFIATENPQSMERLAEIDGLDQQTLAVLNLYTTLSEESVTAGGRVFALQLRSRLVQDLNQRRGYTAPLYRIRTQRNPTTGDSLLLDTISLGTRYAGGPQGIFTRLLLEYGHYSGGIVFEKDPGESLFYRDTLNFSYENLEGTDPAHLREWNVRRGLGAFLSVHAQAELRPGRLLLGDYTAEFGQGLLFGQSFAGRKGGAPTRDPYRSGNGLRPYRSSGEAGYFRGIALDLHPGEWLPRWLEGSLFLSRRMLDGTLTPFGTAAGDTVQSIHSIRNDGYLRTRSEIRGDNTLREDIAGLHSRLLLGNGSVGLTAYHGRYDLPVTGTLFGGKAVDNWSMGSIDGTYDFSAGKGFAELAVSDGGGVAGIAGAALRLPRADVTLSGRYYGTTFYSPHGVAFGESPANPHNEAGVYIGVRTRLFPRAFLSLYGDLYHIPEGNESIPFTVSGVDGMALFDYGVTPELDIGIRLRAERRGDAAPATDELGRDHTRAIDRTIAGGRWDIAWRPKGGTVEARFRLEEKIAVYSDLLPAAQGALTYIDFRWKPIPTLALGSRLLLFNAESFDVQLYEFEQDVPGRLTSVPLNGEGGRHYLLARWQVTASFSVAARYSQTWYIDRETIAAGSLQEIAGTAQSQLVMQIDWEM